MIFSKRIYKLSSGKNISLFAEDENNISIFTYDKITNKYNFNPSSNLKLELKNSNLNYNHVVKLNSNHSCVCYDKNISIIENEKQNI